MSNHTSPKPTATTGSMNLYTARIRRVARHTQTRVLTVNGHQIATLGKGQRVTPALARAGYKPLDGITWTSCEAYDQITVTDA